MSTLDKESLAAHLNDPLAIIRDWLVLETGQTYGEAWQDWQRKDFEAIFATADDGRPKHSLVYIERRRGESKTADSAAVGTADLIAGPRGHRSYAVAASTDQARLLLDSIEGFIDRSPILQKLIKVQKNLVKCDRKGSQLTVLSSEDRVAYGIRARRIFFDELSLQTDRDLWTAMWSAVGKRADAQLVALTMAGSDTSSICWEVRELATRNPRFYLSVREGTEPAPWLSADKIEEMRESLHPLDFQRLYEARWVEPSGSWISREMYDSAETGQETASQPQSAGCVAFCDVGLVNDPSVIAVVHREGERVILDTLRTLQGSKREPVQLEVLEDLAAELTKDYNIRHLIFESPQAVASVQRLQNRLPITVEARYPTSETQAKLWGGLYRLFSTKRLVLFDHDQLRREALSLVVKRVGGRLKTVESSSVHQDHVLALGGAALALEERASKQVVAIWAGQSDSDFYGQFDREPPAGSGLVLPALNRGRLDDATQPTVQGWNDEVDSDGDPAWPTNIF